MNWRKLIEIQLSGSTNGTKGLAEGLEVIFNAANNYSIITKGTEVGIEGGLFMYKHDPSRNNYGFLCNRELGSMVVYRATSGDWFVKSVLGI